MNKLVITLLKGIFYPIHLISYEKYNFRGFLIYLLSMMIMGFTKYLFLYVIFSLAYLLIGQKVNRKIRGK